MKSCYIDKQRKVIKNSSDSDTLFFYEHIIYKHI